MILESAFFYVVPFKWCLQNARSPSFSMSLFTCNYHNVDKIEVYSKQLERSKQVGTMKVSTDLLFLVSEFLKFIRTPCPPTGPMLLHALPLHVV